MTRTELVQKLALNMNYSKRKSGEIVNVILEGIILGVCQDGKTTLRNFGLFRIKHRKETDHYCHFIGKKLKIPASKNPVFRASKHLKKIIDSD